MPYKTPNLDSQGKMPTAVLGSGTASSATFLRGDKTWAVPPGTGGGSSPTLANLPSGVLFYSTSPTVRPTSRTDIVVNFLTTTQPTAMLAGDIWTQV